MSTRFKAYAFAAFFCALTLFLAVLTFYEAAAFTGVIMVVLIFFGALQWGTP